MKNVNVEKRKTDFSLIKEREKDANSHRNRRLNIKGIVGHFLFVIIRHAPTYILCSEKHSKREREKKREFKLK